MRKKALTIPRKTSLETQCPSSNHLHSTGTMAVGQRSGPGSLSFEQRADHHNQTWAPSQAAFQGTISGAAKCPTRWTYLWSGWTFWTSQHRPSHQWSQVWNGPFFGPGPPCPWWFRSASRAVDLDGSIGSSQGRSCWLMNGQDLWGCVWWGSFQGRLWWGCLHCSWVGTLIWLVLSWMRVMTSGRDHLEI